jgi:glycerol-3-phosphate acyltransferase PlsY
MIENYYIMFIAMPLAAYVIGSTPFGFLIARARGVDLRTVGSGNVGATNVARALGRRWGFLAFGLDVLKGLVPVVVAGWLLGVWQDEPPTRLQQAAWLAVGLGAVLGHVLTFWLRFRGGKGVATALGVVLGIFPYLAWPGLAALGLWVAVTLVSRYVSLGSIVAALAFLPLFVLFNHNRQIMELWPLILFAGSVVVLIVVRHISNIKRLLAGTESKIGRRKASPAPQANSD